MSFSYELNKTTVDRPSSRNLFICHTMHAIIELFLSTFLIAYVYNLSTNVFDYVLKVGTLQLSVYATFLLTNVFFSYLTDKTNRIGLYRVSLALKVFMLFLLIFFGEKMATLLILYGFLTGLSESCYYASYNVLKQEMVSRKSISSFSVFYQVTARMVNVVFPIIFGCLLDIQTFAQVSIYVLAITFFTFILSFWVKAKKPEGSEFKLREYLGKINNQSEPAKKIKFLYICYFIYGFTTVVDSLTSICIMLNFGSTFSLGYLTSIIAIFVIIEILLIKRFTKEGKRSWLYFISSTLPIIASMVFIFNQSITTIIIYNFAKNATGIIIATIYDVYRNSNLKEAGLYSEISEHHAVVEIVLCLSRIFSYSLMILIGLYANPTVFNTLFIIFSCSFSVLLILLMVYEKNFFTKTPEEKSMEIIRKCLKNS